MVLKPRVRAGGPYGYGSSWGLKTKWFLASISEEINRRVFYMFKKALTVTGLVIALAVAPSVAFAQTQTGSGTAGGASGGAAGGGAAGGGA
ncbi:MAG: hypothetical protein FJX46_09010, partial [Alphaproteobacteria bacterium]|nr:hypothetical protein [Alphaproteobacteria bacterium]